MSSSGTAVVTAASLRGVEAQLVTVEVSLSGGLPGLDVVGMPDSAVLEARSRVRCAIRASGFTLPRAHATINLAPSELRKSGTAYDLAIAVALLIATSQLPQTIADGLLFVGELALDGSVCPVRGDMAYAMLAQEVNLDLVVSAESPLPGGWADPAPRSAQGQAGLARSPHRAWALDVRRPYGHAGLWGRRGPGAREESHDHRGGRAPRRAYGRPARFGKDHARAVPSVDPDPLERRGGGVSDAHPFRCRTATRTPGVRAAAIQSPASLDLDRRARRWGQARSSRRDIARAPGGTFP